MTWQPIESAPKDGTQILVCDDSRDVFVAEWIRGDWYAYPGDNYDPAPITPIWWMSLPQPPEEMR